MVWTSGEDAPLGASLGTASWEEALGDDPGHGGEIPSPHWPASALDPPVTAGGGLGKGSLGSVTTRADPG